MSETRNLNELAEKQLQALTMKQARKPGQTKGDRFGSTYSWRIHRRDGSVLNGYSKFEGSREKSDKMELLIDNVRMFFKWDYIPTRATKIDYYLNRSHKLEDAVLMFSLYPNNWIFHRPEMEQIEKFAPLRDLLTQLYFNPERSDYQNPDAYFSDTTPAKPVVNLVGTLTRLTPKPGASMQDFLTLDEILDPNKCTARTPAEFATHCRTLQQNFGNQISAGHWNHYKQRIYSAKPHLRAN